MQGVYRRRPLDCSQQTAHAEAWPAGFAFL